LTEILLVSSPLALDRVRPGVGVTRVRDARAAEVLLEYARFSLILVEHHGQDSMTASTIATLRRKSAGGSVVMSGAESREILSAIACQDPIEQ
jgi:hypothetical protein